jgi:hypothetical protein
LKAGDILQVVTGRGAALLGKAENDGGFLKVYTVEGPGFARIEVVREFIPSIPPLPALISNPIYFDT